MNELKTVKDELIKTLPHVSYEFDPAETSTGSSWLDLRFEDRLINIEWKPGKGFGLYIEDEDAFGTGPNEIYRNKEALFRRIQMLFLEHKIHLKLKEIREIRGVSQTELGALLGQMQGSVSKIESREAAVLFKTICSFVAALGGTLEIKAHFEDFDVPLDLSCSDDETKKSA